MAYVISDECVSCGACAAQCPAEAISEGDAHFEINPDACLDCGACADTCPIVIGQAVLFCRKPSIVTSCQPNLLSSRLPLTNASVWTCYTLST